MKDSVIDPLSNQIVDKGGQNTLRWLRGVWDWLITPSVPNPQPDVLRQARLLAAMLVVVVSLGALIEALTIEFDRYQDYGGYLLFLAAVVLLSLAFFLNRAGRLAVATWITVIVPSVAIFVLTFSTGGQPVDVDFLNFLFVPLLFASVFLPERMILVLTLLYLAGMGSAAFLPGMDVYQLALGPASFISVSSGMIYLIFHHRNVLEADRRRELVEKEERYRTLLETGYEGVCILADGKILDANSNFARLFGYKLSEVVGEPVLKLLPEELRPEMVASIQSLKSHPSRIPVYQKDGARFYIETVSKMQTYRGQPAQVIAVRDITPRVQAEEARDQSERLYRSLFEGANDGILLLNFANIYIAVNQKAADMLGYTVQELVGRNMGEVVAAREYPDTERVQKALRAGETLPLYERIVRKKDGTEFPVEVNATLVRDSDGNPLYIQSVVRDITERKLRDTQIRRQVKRLSAIHDIEQAITSSLDLRLTLDILLAQIIEQLGVDAVDILLYKPHSQALEITARRGFHTGALRYTHLRLGESHAGRAALDQRIIHIPDLMKTPGGLERSQLLVAEGFNSYYAVPLVAKGQVKGVLEIFHRTILEPDPEWEDFLASLAAQAAIAIDNAQLFQDSQRLNLDLSQAYEATLEGWAKALELRDKETEGHSQRVTEMTMRLGQAAGIREEDLIHLRRGALLHDIGKMGIPDNILLKPGPLTDEEWEVMRKHPQYACEMLSSITYLQRALDIPYCHHEKWDGSGYPQGLAGSQIPLAARIFAMIDVWDALSSDRPYRKAWPPEKVGAYLQEQSGKHFDPQLLPIFLHLLQRDV